MEVDIDKQALQKIRFLNVAFRFSQRRKKPNVLPLFNQLHKYIL